MFSTRWTHVPEPEPKIPSNTTWLSSLFLIISYNFTLYSNKMATRSQRVVWYEYMINVVVFPHTRGHGTEGSCRWSNERQHRERRRGRHFWGLWGRGGLPPKPGACRGGTKDPSWCRSGCHCAPWLPLHDANRISVRSKPAPHSFGLFLQCLVWPEALRNFKFCFDRPQC